MPLMSASERADALRQTLDYLIQIQEDQAAEWVASGRPPSFSVDGESYSWSSWFAEIDTAITAKLDQIPRAGGSFIVRSKGRA